MALFVLDASLAASWCFRDEATSYTEAVLSAVSALTEATAPQLWAYEIRNTVLVGVRRNRITKADAVAFLKSLRDFPIRLAIPPSYDGVFELADRHGLTVYDAAYLDLAVREGLPLASLDGPLIRAAQASGIAVFQP
jgi:predicted nucleic acid-binding protein